VPRTALSTKQVETSTFTFTTVINVMLIVSLTDTLFQVSVLITWIASTQGLFQLQPSPMDASNRAECLPETRVDLIRSIEDWSNNISINQSVLVLYGLAGAGKSALSTTIANRFSTAGRLGAFLFFDRDVVQRNDPETVIRTIAYQMAFLDHRIKAAISAAVKSTPNVCFLAPQVQFRKLVVEPLLSIRQSGPLSGKLLAKLQRQKKKPVLVMLDALDECGDPITRKNLLEVLAQETVALAPIVRFIITSRADPDIRSYFRCGSHIVVRQLDTTSKANVVDIRRYIQHCAKITQQKNEHLQLRADWPGVDVIQKLVDQAGGLFVWATTAWAFIDSAHYPQKHLDMLLKGMVPRTAEATLDKLYSTALESVGNWDNADFVQDFRMILGTIITVKDPLSSTAIDELLGMPPEQPSLHTIARLGCVLSQGPTVRVLHPSFADFLCTRARCGCDIRYIDPVVHSNALAVRCLQLLNRALTMNIRDLTLSADLESENLSEGVSYACIFWIAHVCKVEDDIPSVLVHLDTFLNRNLLHWLEAMSILKKSRDTIVLLNSLSSWILVSYMVWFQYKSLEFFLSQTNAPNLHELVCDTCRFAQTFANSIEEHPLLVYFSALPFAPLTSVIYQKFHNNALLPTISGGFERSWSPLLLTLAEHEGPVTSVVFSPDGARIISGSHDKTVRIWDILSGVEVVPPMRGHHGFILSVSCSPDGTRVASGSDDMSIRVWDACLGTEVMQIQGHNDWVLSVAFSRDGTRIVSGSRDSTIHVWNILSGIEIVLAIYSQQGPIYSVAFSPDATRIVSGSGDNSVRVWDALTGSEVVSPMYGHQSFVFSVSFSSDGTRIVSGSRDNTIRVWDASSGAEVVRAMCGHEDWVLSVAFSLDGTRIISGSHDKTVRIWDASSGIEVGPVMRGHQGCVLSVAFSSDGTHIVSGARDNTIRMWAATSFAEVDAATEYQNSIASDESSAGDTRIVTGWSNSPTCVTDESSDLTAMRWHQNGVSLVAFSPDGTRVVSGSSDNTIRIWDAMSGADAVTAVHDHQELFFSVMFSADGTRVIARSSDGADLCWDATSGVQLSNIVSDRTSSTSRPNSPRTIEVNSDGWLVHVPTKRTIFKLPAIITPLCSASHEKLVAIGTPGGQVIIIKFPLRAFMRSETRPNQGKARQRRELPYDLSQYD
jgi:WD40 repeat protein